MPKHASMNLRNVSGALIALMVSPALSFAQAYTWEQLREKFELTNPTLRAARDNTDEQRAAEITAFLRPNPEFTFSTDGTQLTPYQGIYRPFSGTQFSPAVSYLHERDHKRELRRDVARETTAISESSFQDQRRGLLFTLRTAFVTVLQNQVIFQNATENLAYWDRELDINRKRYQAGDLAYTDLQRLELQRAQFESDYETALVNVRTAKIQLLMLLNDRTPIEKFDIAGRFDFSEIAKPLEDFRKTALETRPDLRVAVQNVELADLNHKLAVANGSTDPTYSVWWTHNPSFNNPFDNNTIGASVDIPLRIFDRNQGEKARTEIDIRRNERLKDAAEAQVYNDVDSAYYTVVQAVNLLKPYKTKYLPMSIDIRDRTAFAFRNGGASLLDFLDAEKSYRDTRLAYVNLIGSYLTAAAQMNMAAGQEVME
jgi:outer membrane protein, heavy metal efflux system